MIEKLTTPQYSGNADLNSRQTERFSVCQFFTDDAGYEYVRHHVPAEEAVRAFDHYCTSVGARIGTTIRVIIVDSGDVICAEWIHGKGLVFPPKEEHS